MQISRREIVTLGAVGVGGAIVGKVATSETSAAASERMGGIHISVLTKIVSPDAVKGFPHHFTMTLYGPDNALDGFGWGGAFDVKTQEDILNSQMFQCIYSVRGAIKGDVFKGEGLMLFAGNPEGQGQPLLFEANLATGFLQAISVVHNNLTLEGTGVVARI